MSDWQQMTEFLHIAMIDRARGDDRQALEYLDAAFELFCKETGADPIRPKKAPAGRPRIRFDGIALDLMDRRAESTGETRAETLAKWVARIPCHRGGQSESAAIKRLARKWKSRRANKIGTP